MSRFTTRQEFEGEGRIIIFVFIFPLCAWFYHESDNGGLIPIAFGEAIVIALRYDSRCDPHRT
jgi:hypothetical protein